MTQTPHKEPADSRASFTGKRKFTPFDIIILVIGAVLGLAGNALFSGQTPMIFALIALAVLAIAATLAVDRLGAHAERHLRRASLSFREEFQQHYNNMEDQLRIHLDNVHASVHFIADGQGGRDSSFPRPSYNVAEAAVRRARRQILVMGDYSPPPEVGAEMDSDPPRNRSGYLKAIEETLIERHQTRSNQPPLQYRRYIQRPVPLYEQIAARKTSKPGITLKKSDMSGDLQAFDHCARILQIYAAARRDNSTQIEVELRLIPFLPNCPSILIVDDEDVQFTIPTRIDRPGDEFAGLGLLGILAMKDKAKGESISKPFADLFQRLKDFSIPIIRVEGAEVPAVEVEPLTGSGDMASRANG